MDRFDDRLHDLHGALREQTRVFVAALCRNDAHSLDRRLRGHQPHLSPDLGSLTVLKAKSPRNTKSAGLSPALLRSAPSRYTFSALSLLLATP